ncbi:HD domain-containing protein [bacterium]|nr:HD domain-containing protein [bacterium]MBP5590861.1 HD domain-containing protein [bacterium]
MSDFTINKSSFPMQLARLADTRNIEECRDVFFRLMQVTGIDEEYIQKALSIFDDIRALYEGRFKGYKACDTEYHDFRHVIDVTLASIRITDSLMLNGEKFSKNNIFLVGIAAVFHDTGYIPEINDPVENGAVYTSTHVRRSMVFAEKYMSERGYSADDIEKTKQMILITDLSVKIKDVTFIDAETERFAKILASADLIGQMADRIYLEKLLFLYREFEIGQIPYASEADLLQKTIGFCKIMDDRLEHDLDGVNKHLLLHFKKRYDIDEDLYRKGMSSNLKYLTKILEEHPGHHREFLRRDSIVEKL